MQLNLSPSLRSFLDLIAWSEGTSTSAVTQDDGYDVIVSGVDGPHRMVDYDDHPFAGGRPPVVVRETPRLESTASGRYQLILSTWRAYKEQLSLADFSPAAQDAVAAEIVSERGAAEMLAAGNIEGAIAACSNIWASFPGNDYGQGGKSMAALVDKYQQLNQANV